MARDPVCTARRLLGLVGPAGYGAPRAQTAPVHAAALRHLLARS